MLYPKEDEDAHKLQFTCRTCQYTEDASTTCVYRNNLNNSAGETAGVTQDVGSDPTVSCLCLVICELCGEVNYPLSPMIVTEEKTRSHKDVNEEVELSDLMELEDFDEELMDEDERRASLGTDYSSDYDWQE